MRPQVTQGNQGRDALVYCAPGGGYNPPMRVALLRLCLSLLVPCGALLCSVPSSALASDDLQIAVSKKGLGKEVVITQGAREWFMLVEVTPENTVIVRQEKERDQFILDESETHDRPLAPVEVDAAINDYINSVKARAPKP
jgi:hypothetical protein